MIKAIIYLRVSSDEQAEEGTSLETQLIVCRQKAAQLDAEVVAVITDDGVSGALYAARPGMQEALCIIEAGRANCLICAALDRYSREIEHQQAIRRRLTRCGARLVLCNLDIADTPEGKLQFGVLGSFAAYERELIAQRLHDGRSRRAHQGRQPYRGTSPLGYHIPGRDDAVRGDYAFDQIGIYQLIETEAEIVKDLYIRYAAGESIRALAKHLTEAGITTRAGRTEWYPGTVRGILRNPCYKGSAAVGRSCATLDESRLVQGLRTKYRVQTRPHSECITIACPPIVSVDLWDAVQIRLKDNKRALAGNPNNRHLLTGMLLCPTCGERMNYYYSGYGYYGCKRRGTCENRRFVRVDAVEPVVIDAVQEIVRNPSMLSAAIEAYCRAPKTTPDQSRDSIEADMRALAQRERSTIDAQIAGIQAGADPSAYNAIFSQISAERSRLKSKIDQLTAVAVTASFRPTDTVRILTQAAADIDAVFRTPGVTDIDRNRALSTLVSAVHILESGYSIDLVAIPGFDVRHCIVTQKPQYNSHKPEIILRPIITPPAGT